MSDIQIADPLKALINRYPQLSEIISFGYELLMELRQMHPVIDLASLKLTPDLAKIKLKDGFPLLDKSRIDLPSDQFKDVFKRLSIFIAEKRATSKPAILEILEKVENQDLDIQSLAQLILAQDPCSKNETSMSHDDTKGNKIHNKRENPPILNILIWISIKPFGHAFAQALKPYLPSQEGLWHQSYCPVCGSSPQLAYLKDEEGQRHLLCSWCETAWAFPRIQCPCCQNIDQNTLKYFSLDEEKENKEKDRVSVCRKCKKYLKTIDLRKYEGQNVTDLQIDDLATIHLDLLAEREGYERITRNILSF